MIWFTKIKAFVNNHKTTALIVFAILLFALGMGAGIMSKPEKIQYKDKVVEKTVDHIVYKDRIVQKTVYVQAKRQKTHIATETTKKPDGTVIVQKTEDIDTNTNTDVNSNKDTVKDKDEQKTASKTDTSTKLVQNKQINWIVGGGVGVSVPSLLGHQQLGVPGLGPVVIQAEISRRVIGPFFMGVWGNTQGTAGLSLSGAF